MSADSMQVREGAARYLAEAQAQDVPHGYKRTEVGVIPEDWEAFTVKTVASSERNAIVGGPFGSDLVSKDYVARGVPVIRGQNMDRRWVSGAFVFVTPAKAKSLSANLARPGDLVFTQRGTLGQVGLIPEQPFRSYLVSQSQMKLTVNREIADPIFLFYVFSGPQHQKIVRDGTIQTGVPHINLGILRNIPLPVPPIPEQRAIAEALSDVDGLLGSLEALIAKKRAIKQAAMQQLLTGNTRLPGFSGPWETKRLGEIGATYGGLAGKVKSDFGSGNARYVTFLNVLNNVVLDPSGLDFVNVAATESQNPVRRGDLLFNGTSETPGDLAMGAVVGINEPELFLNSFCFGFRIHAQDEYSPLFFAYFFRGSPGRQLMQALAQGATRYNMSKGQFMALTLPLPPPDEQTVIATVLSDMDAEISALERRRDKTRAIKQGMMQQLLTGRVRLVGSARDFGQLGTRVS